MSFIYDSNQIRAWDAFTIKNEPISSIDLMERAAIGCCKKIRGTYSFHSIAIICGKGNNGGDGLAIGRLFAESDFDVTLYICEYGQEPSSDFSKNLERLPTTVTTITIDENKTWNLDAELILDCLFGSGLNRPIEGWLGTVVDRINAYNVPVVSIDIPSGLYVGDNSENSFKHIVNADHTLSFQSPKFPFLFGAYETYIGRFSIIDIGLSEAYQATPMAEFMTKDCTRLISISNFSHKGSKGYLTFVGGAENMIGAALLGSKSAFKTGCGYVGVISNEKIITPLANHLPEAIWLGNNMDSISLKTTAIAIGPGLGTSAESLAMLKSALTANLPLALDADALNILAANPEMLKLLPHQSILTPHIGELHRLIGEANSPELLLKKQKDFSIKHQIYIIQKGAYSKLTTPKGQVFINSSGNAAMASAGMGDALTGMIGAYLAQGYAPLDAAKNGMYYHGLAGDLAARHKGMHGLLTSDLIECIPAALNGL